MGVGAELGRRGEWALRVGAENVPLWTYCEHVFVSKSGGGQTCKRHSPTRRTSPF
jgi:hypothetical protein